MPRRPLQRVQAALAARRYFLGQQTKSQIADELGISRFKVARLIDAAIEQKIIEFVITEPDDLNAELGEAIRTKYGLRAVLVLEGPDLSTSALTAPLGNLAASLLDETLEDGQTLGVAWGRTLAAMAKALVHLPKVDVVQVAGAPGGLEIAQNPVELVHRLSSLGGGKAYPIYGPMWTEDPTLAQRLRQESAVAAAMQKYGSIDVLVVGIGSWTPAESCLCSGFPAAWRQEALDAGVVADVCGTLIDREGRETPSKLDEQGLSITAEQLRRIPQVIGIGGGLEKAGAIAAVLRGDWIDVLVTDAGVARRLLT
ncbi:sugar-binding transcriptional regulator [Labrys wisconsinensis]|uniref:DNA-binding transcriptional regulator LsrR (DeoR family) n=1 Tax=Labrys wisconsinensis TaxID=425677 RepID=A0ABU0JEE9_9HYPH|nr:sugar-binding domain-containing protein [Labrys wisconsinensis]MDQ0471886.1 DNA-binding transcriptional regulator LsrR (DeoR family) [Labrys wisconsinensis]